MILEGKKGQSTVPVMPLDLKVRPIVDEKYIIPKTLDFIKRQAAAKKPFFVYVGYSEMHPPVMVNPNFVGKSTRRGGEYADLLGEMDFHVGQVLDALKEAEIDDNTIVIPHQRQRDTQLDWVQHRRGFQWTVAWRLLQSAVRRQHANSRHDSMAR